MQIRVTMRCHGTLTRMVKMKNTGNGNVDKDMEQVELMERKLANPF